MFFQQNGVTVANLLNLKLSVKVWMFKSPHVGKSPLLTLYTLRIPDAWTLN